MSHPTDTPACMKNIQICWQKNIEKLATNIKIHSKTHQKILQGGDWHSDKSESNIYVDAKYKENVNISQRERIGKRQ